MTDKLDINKTVLALARGRQQRIWARALLRGRWIRAIAGYWNGGSQKSLRNFVGRLRAAGVPIESQPGKLGGEWGRRYYIARDYLSGVEDPDGGRGAEKNRN